MTASVRELTPEGLFNFMSEPTPPVVLQVGAASHRIRGSLLVPEDIGDDTERWVEVLEELERDGRLDSCSPVIVCAEDADLGTRAGAAISSATVTDVILAVSCVHLLLGSAALERLDPLLLGDGAPLSLPSRVKAAAGPGLLFLGDKDVASNLEMLKVLGIQAVVNVSDDIPNFFQDDPAFEYHRVPVVDSPDENLHNYFANASNFIERNLLQGRGVLVHCMFGVSRSPSLVLAYLMRAHGWTYREGIIDSWRCSSNSTSSYNAAVTFVSLEPDQWVSVLLRISIGLSVDIHFPVRCFIHVD